MKTSDYLFLTLCALALFRGIIIYSPEELAGVVFTIICFSTLFFKSKFWAEHILGLGFWESKASDFKSAKNSWFALRFLAFFSMFIVCFFLYFR